MRLGDGFVHKKYLKNEGGKCKKRVIKKVRQGSIQYTQASKRACAH